VDIRRANSPTREDYVCGDLYIERPVSRIVEDEYSGQTDGGEINRLGRCEFFRSEVIEGPDVRVPCFDVKRSVRFLEAIAAQIK